jgi:amino acid adenylation domain-containing protein
MTQAATPQSWLHGEACQVPAAPVHELFRSRARHDPEAIAIRQWAERLTYRQVADRAAALAGRLAAAGAGPGTRIGICLRRTPALPVSELAVLISGAAFVPLDPEQPPQRLRAIIEDSGISITLTDTPGEDLLAGLVHQTINVASPGDEPAGGPSATGQSAAGDVAYIMYTSGSTGRPKGVMVSHGNLTAFISAVNQHMGNETGYQLAAFAAVGFDVSVFEFFAPLVCGGAIHLVAEPERADADRLQRFLAAHESSHALVPPVLLPLLDPDGLPHLRTLITGADTCDPRQVERWAVPGRRKFYNWYGPTEATVASVGTELSGVWDRPLPIGRPLPGSAVYVLDQEMGLCPAGTPGELFIGGPQVSLGYVGSPELTAERFVPDPFGGSGPLYRTGDLAAWDETGMITFLGRTDRQLKIRGRRVEPGEIEVVLAGHPRVTYAVVDVVGATVRAYVTPADAPPDAELREYCAAWLPRHMVPASVTAVDRLPLTASAKVDLVALRQLSPDAGSPAGPCPAREPASEFEQAVARCWAGLLDRPRPRLDDDFFLAGGDSLTAMQLASALRRNTGRDLSAEDILAGRTLGAIAARLSAAGSPASQVPAGSAPALSPAQRRLWFTEQFAPGTPLHNIVLSEQITGALDIGTLAAAFTHVATRQSALRWQLLPGTWLPEVTVADPAPVRIRVDDLSALPERDREAAADRLLDEEARTPIALTGGPLWRVRLLHLGQDVHVIVMTVHHIIFDGWSQSVLYRELGEAYRRLLAGESPGDDDPPAVTFADYTARAQGLAEQADPADVEWWRQHLAGAPTTLDLPRDRPRSAVLSFAGSTRELAVDAETAARVARLTSAEGTTASAVLLAVLGVLLRRLTGHTDLVVGVPVADRGEADFEDLIGFFIRTLPLRLSADDEAAFTDMVRQCGHELAMARQHADVPLERIVEVIGGDRDLARNPLFQVMFNVYNFAEAHLDLGSPRVSSRKAGIPGSFVDLTVYVVLGEGTMRIEAAYNTGLYDAGRVDAFLGSYLQLLRELAGEPGRAVSAASARPRAASLPDWSAPLPRLVPATPDLLSRVRLVARDQPDTVAVAGPDRTLTYADVIRISDAVAAAVRRAPARTGDVAAVLAAPAAILPAVLLGVLAAGARWVVLDRGWPREALSRRLSALAPRVLITCDDDPGTADLGPAVPVIDAAAYAAASEGGPIADVPAGERGYLSLTSGTTGEVKAVHAGEAPLAHFLNWYRDTFRFGPQDRFALLGNVAHDPLLREIFTPLTCGGTLLVPAAEVAADPLRLVSWLASERITVAHLTPQLGRLMTAGSGTSPALPDLRLVALAGDQLTAYDLAHLRRFAPRARLLNCYGTTETPQVQACYEMPATPPGPDSSAEPALATMPVPVGHGIDGAQLLVMSSCGKPAAVGELGEVVIRGHYLSDGYLDPSLTAARYAPLPGAGDGRFFRTGDVGRYGPAGEVTLAGRVDDQVKVRGFRVELAEVEAALCTHPAVERAGVRLAQAAPARPGLPALALHAFVTSAGAEVSELAVLNHVRALLPAYAVPSSLTVLAALPLTGTGKVDRARLPEPPRPGPAGADGATAGGAGAGADAMPSGDLENLILGIWCEVLGLTQIGNTQRFFEIGGHSMSIVEVQWRLSSALGRPVSVVDLFKFPTIRDLAGHLADGDTDKPRPVPDSLLRRRQVAGSLRQLSRRRDRRDP